ncbi:hypothetical protein Taro_020645 [Colocasia esculenta]|uniref:Uncharacterized protein n=1 Tax=Colocasia esculenta TaxID=4460 RepID=A0A843UWW4_COLES|nr:hypothetical protein [Colocasia esculenta]
MEIRNSNSAENRRGVEFTTFWGRVEELLVAREVWIDHKKDIYFPYSSGTTCANRPLGIEQSMNSEPRPVQRMLLKRLVSHHAWAT